MPEPAEGSVPAGDWEPVPEETELEESPDLSATQQIAREVIAGYWGRGLARNKKLEDAGYDVAEINAEISKILNQGL